MASRGVHSSRFISFVISFAVFVFLLGEVLNGGFLGSALAQEPGRKTTYSSSQESSQERGQARGEDRDRDRAYLRDRWGWNWNQRGRTVPPGESAAALRLRAYRQKMAMRAQRAAANATAAAQTAAQTKKMRATGTLTGSASTSEPAVSDGTGWVPLGPAPLASDATGDGEQDYNWVSGRATSVLIDPADSSGNTVLLGGAYGGLWKSTNAGSLSPDPNPGPASVVWQPLIDDQPTLAVGAIALQPGNSNVILVGTGETNNSSDSYYGLGILRSADGGVTWPLQIESAASGQSFLGIGFSKIAFSTANPNLVVAATAGDNGLCLGEESATAGDTGPCLGPQEDGNSPARGLYFSTNGGVTWNRANLTDGSVPASATSVIYNATNATFYAFIRRHGLYSSTDGINFTPLATLPIPGLASANCPASSNATTCLIYRGEFAVVPGRNELYVWIVDVQPDNNGNPVPTDEGIWQTMNGGTSWTQIPDNGITNCGDDAFGPNSGCGVEQGWYNLALSAIPDGEATDVYAGAVNLYKCTLQPGQRPPNPTCMQGDWINLTHVYGCSPLGAPAHVNPDQHGIAFTVVGGTSPGYFAHDGGISRTLDGYSGLDTGSCSGTNQFDSLSQPQTAGNTQTLGSMTEFVSVSVHPTNPDILLGGTQNNGSPETSTATTSSTWQNALGGDGGFTAINPENTNEWFAANPYVTILKCESGTACNDTSFFQIVGSSDLGGDQGAYDTPYILDPGNASEMLVGTCRVWRISTSGTAPLQLSNDFDTLGTDVCTGDEINLVTALAAGGPGNANGDSETVYAVTNGYGPLSGSPGGEVWVTTDAGNTLMTNVTGNVNPNGYAISSVAIDSSVASGNGAYVGIMGFSTPSYPTSHVWQTTNAGESWTDWTGTGLPDAPVNALLVDSSVTPSEIYAGTDVGVFVSSTTTASWTEVGPMPGPGVSGFLPNAPVTAVQLFNPNAGTKTLVASTYGRGIWNYALVAAPGYTNVISNSPQTVFPTQTATFDGTLTAQNGYASPVNLSCTGASPATCTLQPTQETPTATYTLTAGGSVGDYSFDAHAVGTDQYTITHDAPVTLHVVDFNLTAPSPNSVSVGQGETSGASTFQVTAAGSFAGTVTLGCSAGLPAGAACVFSPSNSVSPTSSSPVTVTLTVTAAAGTPLGGPVTVTISATATGAPAAKTQTFELTVTGPAQDFTWTDTGSATVTVLAGQSASYTFSAAPVGGTFSSAVSFACSGLPALTSCGFSPASIAAGAGTTAVTLTISTTGPNLGTESRPRVRAVHAALTSAGDRPYVLPFFTLAWVLVGIVGGGRQKRGKPRLYGGIAVICLGLGLMALISCGGVAGGGGTPPPPTVEVTVSKGVPPSVFPNNTGWPSQTAQFTATVTNASNTAVTWSLTTPNGGTIDANGLYTAPTVGPDLPASVTVTALSQADPTKSASAQETLNPATIPGTYSNIMVTATEGTAVHSDPVTLISQ
jgi:hypothetical protein